MYVTVKLDNFRNFCNSMIFGVANSQINCWEKMFSDIHCTSELLDILK